jgi:hypothetical protein
VQSSKPGSHFLIQIQLASASTLQSAEPQVKFSLFVNTATVYVIRQAGTAEDTILNIYDNSLHVVAVSMPDGQFY